MKRLGAWWRLWIVLTIAWLSLGNFALATYESASWARAAFREYATCQTFDMPANCQRQLDIALNDQGYWRDAFALTFISAAVVWILGLISYAAVRWILAGRKRPG